MNSIIVKSNRKMITVRCSSENEKKESPVTSSRKIFEKKRSISLKDNVNKLISIGSSDMNEYSKFFKELDAIHKAELSQMSDKIKEKFTKSKDVKIIDEENIFVDNE